MSNAELGFATQNAAPVTMVKAIKGRMRWDMMILLSFQTDEGDARPVLCGTLATPGQGVKRRRGLCGLVRRECYNQVRGLLGQVFP